MTKHTSVSLGSHFERFIAKQVANGRFGTASEVVRAGLRLLEDDEVRLRQVRSALKDGEASGFTEDYSLAKVLGAARRRDR